MPSSLNCQPKPTSIIHKYEYKYEYLCSPRFICSGEVRCLYFIANDLIISRF